MGWISRAQGMLSRPEDPRASRLDFELARLTAQNNLAGGVVAIPLIALLMVILAAQWQPLSLALLWAASALSGFAAMVLAARRLARAMPDSDAEREALTRDFILAGSVLTIGWATFGPVMWHDGDPRNNLLVFVFYYGSVAGGAALNGPLWRYVPIHIGIYVPAGVFVSLLQGALWPLCASAFAVYCVLMLALGHSIHRMARDTLMLRTRNDDLMQALAKAKILSDEARIRAEAASRAKSEFLANMSHELRTPLNAILGFSEVIRDQLMGPGNATAYSSYARDIHASGHHLLSLINDILDLAKIESGRYEIERREITLRPLVEEALRLFQLRVERGLITLASDVPPGLLVFADDRALKQILINLVSNAVKFTPAGGRVTVTARHDPDGAIALTVADTGSGIAEADLSRVFEAFGQGRHDIACAEKGTGLGLPIVKGLVEAHGGSIRLESARGEGTRVSVLLPGARPAAQAHAA